MNASSSITKPYLELIYTQLENYARAVCIGCGCRFQGIQRTENQYDIRGALFLFADDFGSALALRADEFGRDAVRARLALSHSKWAAARIALSEPDIEMERRLAGR